MYYCIHLGHYLYRLKTQIQEKEPSGHAVAVATYSMFSSWPHSGLVGLKIGHKRLKNHGLGVNHWWARITPRVMNSLIIALSVLIMHQIT
jgi:hypothetical protein